MNYCYDRKALAMAVSEAAEAIHHLKADAKTKGTLAVLLSKETLATSKRIRNAEEDRIRTALEKVAADRPATSDFGETELLF